MNAGERPSRANAGERPSRARAPARRARIEIWRQAPEDHDFPAAEDFLTLVLGPDIAHATVQRLRKEGLIHRKAKDIIRASRLEVLAPANAHVRADLAKVRAGKSLSPVLLVRGDARIGAPLLIADGYHRVCASFHLDENAEIPCRLVDIARAKT